MTNWKSLGKDALVTGLLAIAALSALSFAGWVSFDQAPSYDLQAELDVLNSRVILGYVVEGEGDRALAAYRYLGEKLPEKLAEDELVERRTQSSWTRLVGYKNKGTPQEEPILSSAIYPQEAFAQYGDSWYYVEYALTSLEAMQAHEEANLSRSFFYQVAHAASLTSYAEAGDGTIVIQNTVNYCSIAGVWDALHDAATGSTTAYTAETSVFTLGTASVDSKTDYCSIGRGFFPFNTSSIPASATISAASLNLYVVTVGGTGGTGSVDNDGNDYITVVQTSQADYTTPTNADYDQCGAINSPTEGIATSERKDLSSGISNGAYLSFTLNATGIGWIKKAGQSSACSGSTGITCLGLREGHDTVDDIPATNTENYLNVYYSERTGTAEDPYLSVTYTAGDTAFWQFQDF